MDPFSKPISPKAGMRRYGMLVTVAAWSLVYLILPSMEEYGMGLHKAQ
jgi:hypothetical protein